MSKMKVKDFSCSINITEKKDQYFDKNGEEVPQGLPPYSESLVFSVDDYEDCPANWINGSDIASSYFVNAKEDEGMWIDFNSCSELTHDVAVVVSIQGINPITGQKTDQLRLEQYKNSCPIHNTPFGNNRLCKECGFEWPAQNYLTTTNTPLGLFWLDGFRCPDGDVRQYIFTSDIIKGIAHQLIGKDKVYAIGIAFYLSKEKHNRKKKEVERFRKSDDSEKKSDISFFPNYAPYDWKTKKDSFELIDFVSVKKTLEKLKPKMDEQRKEREQRDEERRREMTKWLKEREEKYGESQPRASKGFSSSENIDDSIDCCLDYEDLGNLAKNMVEPVKKQQEYSKGKIETQEFSRSNIRSQRQKQTLVRKSTPEKKLDGSKTLEVGAGALLKQKIYQDTNDISYWQEKPSGMIYINYCNDDLFGQIISGKKREIKKEGFMNKLNVGS